MKDKAQTSAGVVYTLVPLTRRDTSPDPYGCLKAGAGPTLQTLCVSLRAHARTHTNPSDKRKV